MSRVYIIAEAGVNHNGDIDIAKKMMEAAAAAGADAIKFQTFHAESLVCRDAGKAEYQIKNTGHKETQYEMLKKLELTSRMHKKLLDYSKKCGIHFLSAPFDEESIELLEELGMDLYKIPSGEITNLPYLRKIAALGKQVILSTGMCTMEEVKEAVEVLKCAGSGEITVLHCNTQYPTPMEDVNLNVIGTMRKSLGVSVGYSDHTQGIEVPIAAVALGASVIEKHFTLDRSMEGPDHKASLEPQELKEMVQSIRNIEKALGRSEKMPTESEKGNIAVARKSIVAKTKIQEGEILTEANITTKRPGTGLSPMLWDEIIGQKACRDFQADEMIEI